MRKRLKYLATVIGKLLLGVGRNCPSCGSSRSAIVDSKYRLSYLRRCANCHLLFRTPTTSSKENKRFYQNEYREGFTTDTPSDTELKALLNAGFAGSKKDYAGYIDVIKALGAQEGDKLLDYGCSWGYGSW